MLYLFTDSIRSYENKLQLYIKSWMQNHLVSAQVYILSLLETKTGRRSCTYNSVQYNMLYKSKCFLNVLLYLLVLGLNFWVECGWVVILNFCFKHSYIWYSVKRMAHLFWFLSLLSLPFTFNFFILYVVFCVGEWIMTV